MLQDFEVLTLDEVAKVLDMNIRTIREYIKDGDINASKIGRRYYVTGDNLKAFIKRHEKGAKQA